MSFILKQDASDTRIGRNGRIGRMGRMRRIGRMGHMERMGRMGPRVRAMVTAEGP